VNQTEREKFRSGLVAWFRQFQRDLPWRRTRDPYRVWLSEVMLQQTRVAAVIPYFARFLERFPDVRALAEAPEEEVLRLWSGLGYYSRARNLRKAAQEIVARHKGEFPRTIEAARALPGIGAYTASAILSIAFDRKHAVLDGNVARVLARVHALRGDVREPARWNQLQNLAEELLALDAPGEWNQAMMELGATLCTPRAPQCFVCPVAAHCEGRKLGIAESLPERRKKRATIDVTLVAAVLLNSRGEALLLPPPKHSNTKGGKDVPTLVSRMWHFPVEPLKSNSIPEKTLRRLVRRYTQKKSRKDGAPVALARVRHSVTYRKIAVLPFLVRLPRHASVSGARKIPLARISSLPISNLTRKIARVALEAAGS
jgi:A/G-specific adenine glycosylase